MQSMNLSEYLDESNNAEFARAIDCSPAVVNQWKKGRRPIPVEHMATIERVTGGAVTRKEMRPLDWARIWPELVKCNGNRK